MVCVCVCKFTCLYDNYIHHYHQTVDYGINNFDFHQFVSSVLYSFDFSFFNRIRQL